MDKVNMMKNKNRRGFFRIYDEVNLFYKKIDEKLVTESQPVFDNISNDRSLSTDIEMVSRDSALLLPKLERKLPGFQFKDNETCNVNISASGMAFTCEDALKEGDYLIIKIQLLSSMAIIATYGKVVYCRNNQPYDMDYPYFVGAHFFGMEDDDWELLGKYVEKKRKQQIRVTEFTLAAVLIVLVAPDLVFGTLFELLHFLVEVLLHGLHLAFEFIEINLDHLIEHLFHTDLHQTQVIVFYILLSFGLYGLYRLLRVLPSFCRRCKRNLFACWLRRKESLQFYWQEQSLFDKFKLIIIGIAVIASYVFFGF